MAENNGREALGNLEDSEEYPDSKVENSWSCHQYAFYKLGLDQRIAASGISPRIMENYFAFVASIKDADIFCIVDKTNYPWCPHTVFINKGSDVSLREKMNAGMPIRDTSLEKLHELFPEEEYLYFFLKKK